MIDNCEHVVTTVADAVARVVDACADIRVLTTSRKPGRHRR